jgi:hypothetical protein
MGGDQVSGHLELERKHGLSYHCFSPRWLRFDLLFDRGIVQNQRGFLLFPLEFRINCGIGKNVCFDADFSDLLADNIEERKLHGIVNRLSLEQRRLFIKAG